MRLDEIRSRFERAKRSAWSNVGPHMELEEFIRSYREDIPFLLELVEEAKECLESLGAFNPEILKLGKIEAWLKQVNS